MEIMQHARSRAIVLQDFESLLNDLNSRKDKFIGNNYVKCQVNYFGKLNVLLNLGWFG